MHKKEVLVDTAFLGKLSCDGKNIETFKKVLSDLKFKPVVHPYIAANELDMYSYFDSLVAEGFVRVAHIVIFCVMMKTERFMKHILLMYTIRCANILKRQVERSN